MDGVHHTVSEVRDRMWTNELHWLNPAKEEDKSEGALYSIEANNKSELCSSGRRIPFPIVLVLLLVLLIVLLRVIVVVVPEQE